MPYDEEAAERVRAALSSKRPGEIKMFGGLCFTVNGNMCVGVLRDDLVVRVAPDQHEQALARPGSRPMDFTGRPMKGFLFVAPEGYRTARALKWWVDTSLRYVASLPPKKPKAKARVNSGATRRRRA